MWVMCVDNSDELSDKISSRLYSIRITSHDMSPTFFFFFFFCRCPQVGGHDVRRSKICNHEMDRSISRYFHKNNKHTYAAQRNTASSYIPSYVIAHTNYLYSRPGNRAEPLILDGCIKHSPIQK